MTRAYNRRRLPKDPLLYQFGLSEEFECQRLVKWLDDHGYRFSHLPLSTRTRSMVAIGKNKRLGVRRGVPDYLVILKCRRVMFIEMKKLGGYLSEDQKEWQFWLGECTGVTTTVAFGQEDAVKQIEEAERVGKLPKSV